MAISDEGGREPVLADSAMHTRYGGLLRFVFEKLFGPIHYPDDAANRVRELSRQGVVVYVARARSGLLALYLNHALERLGLPLAGFVGGVSLFLWQPVDRLWKLMQQRRRPPKGPWRERYREGPPTRQETMLADIAMRGWPALLCLRPPRAAADRLEGRAAGETDDFVRALVAVQRVSERTFYLVPHVLTDRSNAGVGGRTLTDRLFGERRDPGRLRMLAMFLGSLRRATVRVGEPIDLRALCESAGDADDVDVARKARHELNRRMNEEERVVAGPRLLEYETTERHVMRHPWVRDAIERETRAGARPAPVVERRARSLLRSIASRYDIRVLRVLARFFAWVFNRIYDGVVVDEVGLRGAIEASRGGPLVYCPSHKSHIDYLVLSYVLWNYGIAPPHIAAGANLSFFPLGTLFSRSGAFFLRRSFRDDPLYAAVFRAYVHELIATGTSIEFFLEGTRSRTGKVLMPRFGLLNLIVDAWRDGARDEVLFVPVSVDYERIIEARAYERELRGDEKAKEGFGDLLRTTRVLRSRYGRVLLQFGDPISLAEVARRAGLERSGPEPETSAGGEAAGDAGSEARDDAFRRLTERLGYRILHKVATISSVTPTSVVASALLGCRRRGIAQDALLKRCDAIIEFLDSAAARLSESLIEPRGRRAAVLEAVRKLVDEGTVGVDRAGPSDAEPIYRVSDTNRVLLDYYKNSTLAYFAPAAILARCIRRSGGTGGRVRERDAGERDHGEPVPARPPLAVDRAADRALDTALDMDALQEQTRFLSRLFKREFIYPVDATFDSHFNDTLAVLAVRGVLDVQDVQDVPEGRETRDAGHPTPGAPAASSERVIVRDAAAIDLLADLLDSFVEAYWITARTLEDLRAFPLWDRELSLRALERCRRAFLEGEISRPEAASQTLIADALRWMKETGVIAHTQAGKRINVTLTPAYAAPVPGFQSGLDRLIDDIAAYL